MFELLILVSILFLLWNALIIMGFLKEPVLRSFEKYGGDENFYFPMVHLLFWTALFSLNLLFGFLVPILSGRSRPSPSILLLLGVFLVIIGGRIYPQVIELARRHPRIFSRYPLWYSELRLRTSREERRRIAYRWLSLPWRTRIMYNSNDRAFILWADLVILATMVWEENLP